MIHPPTAALPLPGLGDPAPDLFAATDRLRLRSDVTRLCGPRNRLHHPQAMARTEDLLCQAFAAAGWRTERQAFSCRQARGCVDHGPPRLGQSTPPYTPFAQPEVTYPEIAGVNVLAHKEGRSPDLVLVLAHYDTIRDSPGADDNTAAVAALLELARVLGPLPLAASVLLAATDLEEVGFFGARALLPRLRGRRILGALNFETMSFTCRRPGSQFIPPGMGLLFPRQVARIARRGRRGDFTAIVHNAAAAPLARLFAAGLEHAAGGEATLLLRHPAALPMIGPLLDRLPPVRNLARGDHVPFWEVGAPAVLVTDTANFRNPHYHQPSDTPETLDYERLWAITAAAACAIARLPHDAAARRPRTRG